MTMRFHWQMLAAALFFTASPTGAGQVREDRFPAQETSSAPQAAPAGTHLAEEVANEPTPQEADTDLFALMSGRCSTLNVAGRTFECRTVAYAHGAHGRAYFTIALEDPADHDHIISFSGENGRRPNQNLYELPIDRMLLNSKYRPKIDGLPVPFVESSAGICRQLGNFAQGQISSIVCSAMDNQGRKYELRFDSDGSPITLRRVRSGPPTIRLPS
jgi:hypothetical protein